MKTILERYRPLYDGDAGGAAGGAAGGDKGGGAAGGDKGGGGADGGDKGGGAAEPFYKSWNLDADSVKFIEDRKFDGPGTILKSAIESDRVARSRNVIEKPDQKNVKDWKGFSELGWTEDATKYTVAKPKVEQGQVLHDGMFSAFTKASHAAKLAPWQAEAVFGEVFKAMNKEIADEDAKGATALADLETSLRSEWGQSYPAKKTLAERAMKQAGLGAKDAKLLDQALTSPGLVKLFAQFGELMGEDRLGGGGGGGGPQTIESLEAEIRKMHGDENIVKIINDERHPQHKDYVTQRQGLIDRLAQLKGRAA